MSLYSIVKLIETTVLVIKENAQFDIFFEHFIKIFKHCEECSAKTVLESKKEEELGCPEGWLGRSLSYTIMKVVCDSFYSEATGK
jgi:hypothetical protein